MPVREIVQSVPSGTRTHTMDRVLITGEEIIADWMVVLPNGRMERRAKPISAALFVTLTASPAFANALNQIRDDTYPRISQGL